ncbi:MAG: DNA repair protein RecN [Bdellovibrionales bacterium]|nr:DNA repair protein RecN [Bdellovibrionales bacterium]
MLLDLKVSNFAIIENIHISFREGLNILSGETGAGKSVLLKSLSLLMGEKGLTESVRDDAHQATIEGSFDISERPDVKDKLVNMGIDEDSEELIVRRVISKTGKSRIYLNGALSTLSSLRKIVAPLIEFSSEHSIPLIEMTGQHDNRNLQSKQYHLDLLDSYANSWSLRNELWSQFKELQKTLRSIESIESETRTRAQRIDFLTYQKEEIESMKLQLGEDSLLEETVRKLKASNKLLNFSQETEYQLYSGEEALVSLLHRILSRAEDLSKSDPQIVDRVKGLYQAKSLVEEVSLELRDYEQSFQLSSDSLEECEERLSQLRLLQKKYGATVDDILKTKSEIETEISSIELSDDSLKELRLTKTKLEDSIQQIDSKLHKIRTKAADLMSSTVNDELKDLNMKGLIFKVHAEKGVLTSHGSTQVEFVTRTNKSEKFRSITKFASGGELSRILLAIKSIVGRSNFPRTFLFDEVDTGVSGETAEKVGRKLNSIARGQQVICVTHLPQVAAFADSHFYIHKEPSKKGVNMHVQDLSQSERIQELARLLSGEKISQTSLKHAKQLLKDSHVSADLS